MLEVRRYVTSSGKDVVGEWLSKLEPNARARIVTRIDRLSLGNFGDSKSLRAGVSELRIDWGPGYRLYYGMVGRTCVILLCGGDKRKQTSDIERAIEYFEDFKQREHKQ